jgi:23S rRNA (guanosine2251-2'-O)-methyltransferase
MLELRNPHSILAALQVRPSAVKSIAMSGAVTGDAWAEVAAEARRNGTPVAATDQRSSGRQRRSGAAQRGSERTSAAFALVEPPSPIPLDLLWQPDDSGNPGLWLALDHVQDPQNLGAIFRLAGFFGVRGVVMLKDRSASLTSVACDVAAGGAEHVSFSVVANLAQAIEKAQQNEIWVAGTCERADSGLDSLQRDRHWMLVVGNEGAGLRRLTREKCDELISVPAIGPVSSLNVATATAVCLALMTAR